MTNDPFEYDVALSFAAEDKPIAEELADLLIARNIAVFLDEYASPDPWGKDILNHLVNLYARKTHYCVLLISKHYPLHEWTEEERASVSEAALRDAEEYIIPLRLDDHGVPGIETAKGYRDLRHNSLEQFVSWLEEKLAETNDRSGPPSKSHDLRSGNVP